MIEFEVIKTRPNLRSQLQPWSACLASSYITKNLKIRKRESRAIVLVMMPVSGVGGLSGGGVEIDSQKM